MSRAREIADLGSPAASGLSNRSLIINGAMTVDQRHDGSSFTIVNGNATTGVIADRFRVNETSGAVMTGQRVADAPVEFEYSSKLTVTTADSSLGSTEFHRMIQPIEGKNISNLNWGTSNAKTLTLTFYVKSSLTGQYYISVFNNAADRTLLKGYTISSANTWEKKTITYPGDTTGALDNDNARILDLNFWLGVGSDFSSGTLNTSWNSSTNANRVVGQVNAQDNTSNNIYFTGIQLEAGTSASDFEFLPFDVNFDRCQRYFQTCFLNIFVLARYDAGSGTPINCFIYPKEMRASPTYGTTGTFTTTSGFAGTPTGGDIKTMSIALTGANSEAANDIVYANGGSITLNAEL